METTAEQGDKEERASMRPGPATGLPRFEGSRAEIAHAAAELLDASGAADTIRERAACVRLARLYVARGTDLDSAVRVARRALDLEDDPGLRVDLAGWLAGLGDAVGAAHELRESARRAEGEGSARTLVRAAVLLARARRPEEASEVLQEVRALDAADPMASELYGSLAAWAPEVVSPALGARAFIDAAKRRAATGDKPGALEDHLRAFELAPDSSEAARGAVRALIESGRVLAADELAEDFAASLSASGQPERAIEARLERLGVALEASNMGRAVAAALDLGLSAADSDIVKRVDEALARAGLYELLAVRLERRARTRSGTARAEAFEALARLYSGPLAEPERAIEATIDAASADVQRPTPLAALRDHAERTRDFEPLVEALVRIAQTEPTTATEDRAARLAAALELSELASGSADDPAVGLWAADRIEAIGDPSRDAERVRSIRERLGSAAAERTEELARLEAATGAGEDKLASIERLARLSGASPSHAGRRLAALATAARAGHAPMEALRKIARIIERGGEAADADLYESVLRARLEAPLSRRDHAAVRAALARLAATGSRGDAAGLDEVLPLLDVPEVDAWGAALVLDFALASGKGRDAARALESLVQGDNSDVRGVLLAAASSTYLGLGLEADARRAGQAAVVADTRSARAWAALARASMNATDREAAVALERAMGVVAPRAALCRALARCLEAIGEGPLAYAWTQRWAALAPGFAPAVAELLRRSTLGRDAARIADALTWVLAQPDPPDERASAILDALALLFEIDRAKAGPIARRSLDVFGPKTDAIRERLIALGDAYGDAALSISALERWVAATDGPQPDALVAIARRRLAAGDVDGASRELGRAVTNGADPRAALDLCDEVERAAARIGGFSSDGLLAMAEARVRSLGALLVEDGPDATESARSCVAEAWRLVGALRWDLASDPRGSEQALFAAAAYDRERGLDRYAEDLFELASSEEAAAALFERLELLTESDPNRLPLALATSRAAAEHGLPAFALDAALAALAIDPGHAEGIALAETQAPLVEGGEHAIDRLYESLAARALGMYGRRAAHYRAARQLERFGARDLALKHALAALEAVPNEWMSWLLLVRMVDPDQGSEDAVSLLERIATSSKGDDRSAWLKRALELTGRDRAGLERRIDVLIRALSVAPDAGFVRALDETLGGLAASGGLPELALERVERVTETLLPKIEGPDGARVAALLCRVLATHGALKTAFDALEHAITIDGDVEVFEQLWGSADALAGEVERTLELIGKLNERLANKHALIGPPLLRLGSRLADAVGESKSSAHFLEQAERRDESAPATNAQSPESFADPFADSLFDSEPPPAATPAAEVQLAEESPSREPAPEALPAPPESAPLVEAHPISESALPSLPEPSLAEPQAAPEAQPGARGARSSRRLELDLESTPLPDFATPSKPSVPTIRDGFDALFDDKGDRELEAQETAARERGDHEEVSALLHKRITTSTWAEQVRILKLRRAAVLEQRLDRDDDARRELSEILDENPDDRSALSFLADLHAKKGEHEQAGQLWQRVMELPGISDEEARDAAMKAARAFLLHGDGQAAIACLDAIPEALADQVDVLRLRLEALSKTGDTFSQVLTIDHLLAKSVLPDSEAADLLVVAARAAFAQGDEQGALIRARRAAKLAPHDPDAVLEAARLEYRARGMGTPREAQAVVDALGAISGTSTEAQTELLTFLHAEALDVIQGGGAGMRELSKRHAELGNRPLLALGIAERLARSRSYAEAVPLFEAALEGDLRGLRSRGRVTLAAFDAALNAAEPVAARSFFDALSSFPEMKTQVERRERELAAYDDDPEVARKALDSLVRETTGFTKARFLHRLASLTVEKDLDIAVALFEEAITLARRDRPLAEKIRDDLVVVLEKHGPLSFEPPPLSVVAEEAPPAPPSAPASSVPVGSVAGDRSALVPPSHAPTDGAAAPTTEPHPTLREAGGKASTSPSVSSPVVTVESRRPEVARAPESYRPTLPEAVAPPTPSTPPSLEPAPVSPVPVSPPPAAPSPRLDTTLESPAHAPAPSTPAPPTTESVEPVPAVVSTPPAASTSSAPPRSRRLVPITASVAPPARPLLLDSNEQDLYAELSAGDLDSGLELAEQLESIGSSRARDVVAIRRHICALAPGDLPALRALRDAARADRGEAYARALDHVLALGTSETVAPPPLWAQPREPELLAAWMFRDIATRETEALGIVWATGILRRELASYQLSGSDRVALTVGTPLGEAYSEIATLLGSPRPLFHKKTAGPMAVTVGLLAQPAILVAGDVSERSPDLSYALGGAHASCHPELVLAAHLPEANLKRVMEAVMAAFGPIRPHDDAAPASTTDTVRAEVARLAGELWQLVAPRNERRLRELAESPLEWRAARGVARRAMRRAGLLASGDLGAALRQTFEELGVGAIDLSAPGALARAAEAHREVADLVRFATSSEYAEARWQAIPPSSLRRG
jgi:hypothetical protein